MALELYWISQAGFRLGERAGGRERVIGAQPELV